MISPKKLTISLVRRYILKSNGRQIGARSPQPSRRDDGDLARDRRDWVEAARLYKLHLEAIPDDVAAMIQLGHALKESGSLDEAAQAYARALEGAPADDDLYLQIGHLEKLRGNRDLALENYRKSYEINRNNTNARNEMLNMLDSSTREAAIPITQIANPEPRGGAHKLHPPLSSHSMTRPVTAMRIKNHEKQLNTRLNEAIYKLKKIN